MREQSMRCAARTVAIWLGLCAVAACDATVDPPRVVEVTVTDLSIEFDGSSGPPRVIRAVALGPRGNAPLVPLSWNSSNRSVVDVTALGGDSARLTPKGRGTATVSASAGGVTSKLIFVTVRDPLAVTVVIPARTLSVGAGFTGFAPVVATGGRVPLTFAITPALPTGLVFASSTGTISGVAQLSRLTTRHTVTVTDAGGAQAAVGFDLSVLGLPNSLGISVSAPTQGIAGAPVAVPPVQVRDDNQTPLPNTLVIFTASGGGRIVNLSGQDSESASIFTDSLGFATIMGWRLSPIAGANTLVVRVSPLLALTLRVTGVAGAASRMQKNPDLSPTAGGAAATVEIGVIVQDANGNAVAATPATPVTFTVTEGGGAITTTNPQPSDTAGKSGASWRLGAAVGRNVVRASSGTLPHLDFEIITKHGPLAVLVADPGNPTIDTVGKTVTVGVIARDANSNVVPEARVQFSVTGGGSIPAGPFLTDSSGVAPVLA